MDQEQGCEDQRCVNIGRLTRETGLAKADAQKKYIEFVAQLMAKA